MFIENEEHRYILARWCYLMGEPILSDIEYDALEKEMRTKNPGWEYSYRSWSLDECPKELLQQYGLTHLIQNTVMGYQAESIDSILTEYDYNNMFSQLREKSRVSFKIDGWNCRVSYFNGYLVKVETRGRSGSNLNITALAPLFPSTIPHKGRVAITGELNIPFDKWLEFRAITGNSDQRSSVRTAIAKEMPEYLSFLAFDIYVENGATFDDKYEELVRLGFTTPFFKWVEDFEQLNACLERMSKLSERYNYLTDGLVIENSRIQLAIRLGAWQEQNMVSYVTGYAENYGMYGTAMNVRIYPITREGKRFEEVSITNISNIISNGLKVGAPIAFNLRSSANVVIDATETRALQERYKDNYETYCALIEEGAKV